MVSYRCYWNRLGFAASGPNQRKYCTVVTNNKKKWKNSLHIYSYSFNWGSVSELAHLLARDVIINENGLVVLNKPYGIAKEPPVIKDSKIPIAKKLNTALVGEKNFYLSEILPSLAYKLGYPFLEPVKIPERYTSGVTILSASQELSDHIRNCIKKTKARGQLLDTYNLVCVGSPTPLSFNGKVGITYEEDLISGGVQPILVRKWSQNAIKQGKVVTVTVEHNTVCQSNFASLVEIKPSRTKAHFLRIYMSYMLSPILGDNLHGSRVQKIGSTAVAISPFSDRSKMPQRLEDSFLNVLGLERKSEIFIPAHTHLQKVKIMDFHGKGQPLDLEAPFPEFFQWTCKRLFPNRTVEKEEENRMEC